MSTTGVLESQLSERVRPAAHRLRRLAQAGFVKIKNPAGDGTLIVDPIHHQRKLFEKQTLIDRYCSRLQAHAARDREVKNVIMNVLRLASEAEVDAWLRALGRGMNFGEYNAIIDALKQKFNLLNEGYGYLNWRKMAFHYRVTDKTKGLFAGG
jgi:hypothetical protein